MELGIDSFASLLPHPLTGRVPTATERMGELLLEIDTAEQAGLDSFGLGEHHRAEYIDSAAPLILAAAAGRTKRIRLHSAVTVLSAADPVRIFQEFATLDLITQGRAELVVGRGSFTDAFPLFGLSLSDYNDLFTEKLALLLKIREGNPVNWSGRFRPALVEQDVFPRPHQEPFPLWIGVGGTAESFARAGRLGIPLMIAIIGGAFESFRPMVDLYREEGRKAGHRAESLKVGIHALGFVGETTREARDGFFPGWFEAFSKIGLERGWPPITRNKYERMCDPGGAILAGDATEVARKILRVNDVFGGISRLNFQMSFAAGDQDAMLRSIRLLGEQVRPRVQDQLMKKRNS